MITRYMDCSLGASVELWTMLNGPHTPSIDETEFRRSVIEWLLEHPNVDCNGNGLPDDCDIADGFARDVNANRVPDDCELDRFGDLDLDGDIDLADYLFMVQCFRSPNARPPSVCCSGSSHERCDSPADLDHDDGDDVDLADLIILQSSYTESRDARFRDSCPDVTAVSHLSNDPVDLTLLSGELPRTIRIDVVIPELRNGSITVTSSNPAVAGNTTIRYRSAGRVRCRTGFVRVQGPGTAALALTNDMGIDNGPAREIRINVVEPQCVLRAEAEDFDDRVSNDGVHDWRIVPDEVSDIQYRNASNGRYLRSLPFGDKVARAFEDGPVVSYPFVVEHPGTYRVWVQAAGNHGGADEFHLRIREAGGEARDAWRWRAVDQTGDLNDAWQGNGRRVNPSVDVAADAEPMMEALAPGNYSLEIGMREDGSALDRIVIVEALGFPIDDASIGLPCPPIPAATCPPVEESAHK